MAEDREQSRLSALLEWVGVIVLAVLFTLGIRAFVAEVYLVPSGSMLETIQLGDRLVGEKVSYHFHGPAAGDVVTFDDPDSPGTTLIKRVVAVGGQTVDLRDGVVYVDGVALDEPYTKGKPSYPIERHSAALSSDITYPYTVPSGSIWVMGDNRTNSLDSRYFGAVRVSEVTSHAVFIFWPFSDASGL